MKGKDQLIKNIPRNINMRGRPVIIEVPFMVGTIANERAKMRAIVEFVSIIGTKVRVTGRAKNTQKEIVRMLLKEMKIGRLVLNDRAR